MDEEIKVCFVCGVNTNKMKRAERYNYIPPMKKKGKFRKDEDSDDSGSDDSLMNSKSKKKTPQRSARAPAVGSRQTRNQNPKTFAVSLCKVMELPATPDEPFLQIFSRAHYCPECLGKVKEAHSAQMELEKIQDKIHEARVDFEIDFSKHLQKLPACRNLLRTTAFDIYEEDIKMILDFNGSEKKAKMVQEKKTAPKRERRQAAINSSMKMKRKLKDSGSEDEEEEEEEEVKVKPTKKIKEAAVTDEEEFLPDETATSSETEKDEPDGAAVDVKEESSDTNNADNDNGSTEIIEEVKPVVEVVKPKKDPNLKCPHCPIPRYFNIAGNLEEHISKCHGYVCDTCDKTFKYEGDLRKHKATHVKSAVEDKSQYVCGFCDQEFQLKKYLEDHLDQHPESKPLNCHQCGRGFSRKESLQKAFQIFKGENVEPCKNCGKNLNLKDYLEHNKSLKQQ